MAISIDTVYQRVLALANKEQRGYITPQELNLFANMAQQEIFEQYFYDLNQATRIPGNDTVYADVDNILEEKLQMLENTDDSVTVAAYAASGLGKILPSYIYRVHRVELNARNCEILSTKDFNDCINSGYLTQPNDLRPIVNIRQNIIRCRANQNVIPTTIFYFKKPIKIQWGYVIVNKKAFYDPTYTTNCELHESEESELVYKILKLAGVAIKKDDIMQAGQGLESLQIQQEKQ